MAKVIVVGVIVSFILGYLTRGIIPIFQNPENINLILLSLFWFNILMYIDLSNKNKKNKNE
jgi:hypothetical protein